MAQERMRRYAPPNQRQGELFCSNEVEGITMSASISVEEAQAKLKEIIHQLSPGEELVITENQQPVAKLVSERAKAGKPLRPGPGLCRGAIVATAPDFDAPLDDMKEYME